MRVRGHRSEYGSHFDDVDRSAHDGVCSTGLYKYSQGKKEEEKKKKKKKKEVNVVTHFQLTISQKSRESVKFVCC